MSRWLLGAGIGANDGAAPIVAVKNKYYPRIHSNKLMTKPKENSYLARKECFFELILFGGNK